MTRNDIRKVIREELKRNRLFIMNEGLLKARDQKRFREEDPEGFEFYENVLVPLATKANLKNKINVEFDMEYGESRLFVQAIVDLDPTEQLWYPVYMKFLKRLTAEAENIGMSVEEGDPEDEDGVDFINIFLNESVNENKRNRKLSESRRYIRNVILEEYKAILKEIENETF